MQRLLKQSDWVLTSLLTSVELSSSLAKAVRMNRISQDEAVELDRIAKDDLASPPFSEISVSRELVVLASHYLRLFALRASDAIHVATAQDLARQVDITMVSNDQRMLDACKALNLAVIEPSDETA